MSRALADTLKAYALESLGFDLVGIAAATPLEGAARLREWVGRGHHAGMGYMAGTLEARCDPGRFLPGAQSVVCVAMSYHDPPEPPELAPRGDRPVVARYARRSDYHKVIKRRLVRLGRFLRTLVPAVTWRIGVDEHPLLERELAELAGLGWIGKNTCLINRKFGSELLIGELVTDLALPPDQPDPDHCGTCTSCLDACPTRALPIPRLLDARRCISYLTIEHRSEIGEDLHRPMGAHLFGCDICQAVCPWNVRARRRTAEPLRPRPHLGTLSLGTLDRLEPTDWDSLAVGTPLRRLSFARFRRNLGIVAGNLRNPTEPSGGTMKEHWLVVSTTDDVGDRGKVFTYPDGPFEESGILVRVGGTIVAWKNLCRHLAVRLDRDLPGSVMDREGRNLVCGQHGAVFRAEDGLCIEGPCSGSHLKTLKVRVDGGRVLLDLSALGGLHAAPLPDGTA